MADDDAPPQIDTSQPNPPPDTPTVMAQGTATPPLGPSDLGVPRNIQQQATQSARPGVPIVWQLISDMRNAGQPGHPGTRLEGFESFLGNFINALGQGFANEGHGPGAWARGAGAALTAPLNREVAAQQFGSQQAAAAQQQQQVAAQTQREQAQTALTKAQTDVARQRIPMIGPDGQPITVNGQPIMIPATQGLQYSGQVMRGSGAQSLKGQDPKTALGNQYLQQLQSGDDAGAKATLDQLQKLSTAQKPPTSRAPNEIELIQRAQTGDTEAVRTLDELQKRRVQLAAARGQAFGMFRLYNMSDPDTGRIQPMFGRDIMTAQAQGKQLIPSGPLPASTIINLQRLGSESAPAISGVRQYLNVYDNASDRAIFARVMRDNPMGDQDPNTWMGTILNQVAKENLSDDGKKLIPRLTRLNETTNLLRSTLGLPATNSATALTLRMIPSATTPNSSYARDQMNQLEQVITQAGNVPALGGGGGVNPSPGRGGAVSLQDLLKAHPPTK